MTDRFHSLTVVLETDIREDDCEMLMNAIRMIRGVLSVDGNVRDIIDHMAEVRAKQELKMKLLEITK